MKLIGNLQSGFFGKPGIAYVPIKALRPEVRIGIGADQLQRHVELAAFAGEGTFHDGIDAELVCNFRKRAVNAFILHYRGARSDAERGVARDHGSEFVCHAVG